MERETCPVCEGEAPEYRPEWCHVCGGVGSVVKTEPAKDQ